MTRRLVFFLNAVCLSGSCLAAELSPQEQRGQQIYSMGLSASGNQISARLGEANQEVSAGLLPCANCHGPDGRGGLEGGLQTPDIRAVALARTHSTATRRRDAYSSALLKRAITMGFDSSGNRLDRSMPRFQMQQSDATDLLAYLAVLGSQSSTGVSEATITINLVGAPLAVAPELSVYGRRIQFQHDSGADALLTIDLSVDGSASLIAAEREQIPTIVLAAGAAQPGHYGFVLGASEYDQLCALRAHATDPAHTVQFTSDCAGITTVAPSVSVQMTARAAQTCDLRSLPSELEDRVRIAASRQPIEIDSSALAQSLLSLTTKLLAELGRDPSRSSLRDALESVTGFQVEQLPPISWSADRHYGSTAVMLLTLDLRQRRLLAKPGWVDVGGPEFRAR